MPTDSHIVSAVSQTEPTREYDGCSDVLFQFDLIKGDIPVIEIYRLIQGECVGGVRDVKYLPHHHW